MMVVLPSSSYREDRSCVVCGYSLPHKLSNGRRKHCEYESVPMRSTSPSGQVAGKKEKFRSVSATGGQWQELTAWSGRLCPRSSTAKRGSPRWKKSLGTLQAFPMKGGYARSVTYGWRPGKSTPTIDAKSNSSSDGLRWRNDFFGFWSRRTIPPFSHGCNQNVRRTGRDRRGLPMTAVEFAARHGLPLLREKDPLGEGFSTSIPGWNGYVGDWTERPGRLVAGVVVLGVVEKIRTMVRLILVGASIKKGRVAVGTVTAEFNPESERQARTIIKLAGLKRPCPSCGTPVPHNELKLPMGWLCPECRERTLPRR